MVTEVELKAHAINPEGLSARLSELAAYRGTFEKDDVYYLPSGLPYPSGSAERPGYGLRVRKEKSVDPKGISLERVIVTYKSKEIRDGIEVNDENEFEVSSCSEFEEFLSRHGFKEFIRKSKKGRTWDNNGMTVELTEVGGLGWFVELEILLSEREDEAIRNDKEKLLGFIDLLGIPRESIESRSYASMLTEKS